MKSEDKITPKQTKFVREYLKDFNMTKAAIRAGYTKRSAHSTGHDLLKKPDIQKFLNKKLKLISEKADIDQAYVLQKTKLIAEADICDVIEYPEDDKDSNIFSVKRLDKLTKDQRYAVKSVEYNKYGPKITLESKSSALQDLAKYVKLGGEDEREKSKDIYVSFHFDAISKEVVEKYGSIKGIEEPVCITRKQDGTEKEV